jgi:tight adherence protein B
MDTRILFFICVAIAVIFLVEALYMALVAPLQRKRAVNKRLSVMEKSGETEDVMVKLKADRGIFGQDLEMSGKLSRLLVHSGLTITMPKFLTYCVVIFVAVFAIVTVLTVWPIYFRLPLALFLGFVLPLQVIKYMRNKRQHLFNEQLPDSLDVIVRSLRSGHPVPVALGLVAREMPDPTGTEFGLVVDEMTYGLELSKALSNLYERVGIADLSLLVTAVTLQTQSGGNLGEVLSNLSKVLRDRFQLRRKVRAFSAEARFSAYGLTILPMVLGGIVFLMNPQYYTEPAKDPIFFPVLGGLAVWSLIGDYVMYRMINFKY